MKQKLKKRLKTILIMVLVFIMLFNNISFATGPTAEDVIDDIFGVVDGIAGLLLNLFNAIPVTIGGIIQLLAGRVASIGQGEIAFLTMEDILFHQLPAGKPAGRTPIPLLDVNFFNGNTIFKDSIATWYYGIRNLAIILSLIVLLYVGIRMAISTLAEDKAKYKKMLVDWIVGFITIFFIHYIIIITININNALVSMLVPNGISSAMSSYAGYLAGNAVNIGAKWSTAITCTILYLFLVVMICSFLITYIKRMLTTAFLIIISPIITVTYSIDKMGDGKAQALNTWLKEFIYNIVIQPFHCIIYLVFMTVAMEILEPGGVFAWVIGGGGGGIRRRSFRNYSNAIYETSRANY